MQDTNGIVILNEVQIGMKCQTHEERQIQHNSVGCYQAGSELKYNHQKGCGEQWKQQSRWQKTY